MTDIQVDVAVLGWGKGGKTLAATLSKAGRSIAVVERSPQMYGGSCINVNCIPTKILVHQGATRPDAANPEEWFSTSVDRRDALVDTLRAKNHAMLEDAESVTLIDGEAHFIGPRRIEVRGGDARLVVGAETVVINTGSVPSIPPIEGIEGSPRVHTSTTLQHVDPLPKRLVVVGGGYVGLEFAGMFADFGAAVTLVDHHDTFLAGEDRDVAGAVRALLEERGVEVVLGSRVTAVDDQPDADVVTTLEASSGAQRELPADAVLLATGRRPATDGLGLEAAGVETDDRGFVVVDAHLRTTAPGVFAVGDVNGGPQFTYISLDDHRIVLDQLTGSGGRSTDDRVAVPSTTFLTPPLARVGLNETQAREQGREVLVASKAVADIAAMPRPKIVGETHGLIKVLVDPDDDLILGATVFCVEAQEVINLLALAMRSGTTASQLRDGIWIHPSIAEGLNEVLADLRPA